MQVPGAGQGPRPKYLAASPGKGHNVVTYWNPARTPHWANRTQRFSDTAWTDTPREAWDPSLRRTMTNAWWTVRATHLEREPGAQSPHFTWKDRVEHALHCIERHEGFEQPWVAQQKAKQATARRKKNKRKPPVGPPTGTSSGLPAGLKRKRDDDSEDGEIDGDADKDLSEGKSRKIRIFPTTEQKALIKRWIGTARWTYNQCNAAIKAKICGPSKAALRALFVNTESIKSPPAKAARIASKKARGNQEWVLDTPYDVRFRAVAEIVQAYSNGLKKHGPGGFDVKFRQAKRMRQETITLRGRDWGRDKGAYADVFRADRLKASETLPKVIECDFKVVRTRLGQYYLSIPIKLNVRSENQAPIPQWIGGQAGEVVAIDPGVTTPFTCFDPQGYVYEIGIEDFGRVKRLCYHMDNLQSRFSQPGVPKKKRYSMRRAWLRMHRRVRNLVDDLHRKTAKWLCETYKVILYPHYETSNMVIKKRDGYPYAQARRHLSSKTARSMLTWAHYRFKQHLLHKIREYPWCRVVLVNEAYTVRIRVPSICVLARQLLVLI